MFRKSLYLQPTLLQGPPLLSNNLYIVLILISNQSAFHVN